MKRLFITVIGLVLILGSSALAQSGVQLQRDLVLTEALTPDSMRTRGAHFEHRARTQILLATEYERQGNIETALAAQTLATAFLDSAGYWLRIADNAAWQSHLDTAQTRAANKIASVTHELKLVEAERQWIYVFVVAALVIMSAVWIVLLKKARDSQQLVGNVQRNNDELHLGQGELRREVHQAHKTANALAVDLEYFSAAVHSHTVPTIIVDIDSTVQTISRSAEYFFGCSEVLARRRKWTQLWPTHEQELVEHAAMASLSRKSPIVITLDVPGTYDVQTVAVSATRLRSELGVNLGMVVCVLKQLPDPYREIGKDDSGYESGE